MGLHRVLFRVEEIEGEQVLGVIPSWTGDEQIALFSDEFPADMFDKLKVDDRILVMADIDASDAADVVDEILDGILPESDEL